MNRAPFETGLGNDEAARLLAEEAAKVLPGARVPGRRVTNA